VATIIRTDGTETDLQSPQGPGKGLTLAQLKEAVGGYIEIVHRTAVGTLPDGCCLVVNDEGMVHDLPINARATELAGQPIAGDVVLARWGTEID
jgi:hypothetical protein